MVVRQETGSQQAGAHLDYPYYARRRKGCASAALVRQLIANLGQLCLSARPFQTFQLLSLTELSLWEIHGAF